MRVVGLDLIRASIGLRAAVAAMRAAMIAQARGECDTPMPMHLAIDGGGEVHLKSSCRRGGRHFALKMAGTFATRANGLVLLIEIESGETVAYFEDGGYLTDLRTAAATAMVARELGRTDSVLGILGSGIQARLQAELHAAVLPVSEVHLWARNRERAQLCARDIGERLPEVRVVISDSAASVAASSKLLVTATAARAPLLWAGDLRPGTHVAAVGADSAGKQELDPEILRGAALLLVDSVGQCERLGELQHALSEKPRAIEIGAFCAQPIAFDRAGVTMADFTGLGAQDLFIAEACLAGLGPE